MRHWAAPHWISAVNTFFAHLITIGDAASQVLGRLIPVKADGEWQCLTMSANESISGAAWRWEKTHGWKAREVIDLIAKIVTFGKDSEHCLSAFLADYHRAVAYREMAEALRGTHIQVD